VRARDACGSDLCAGWRGVMRVGVCYSATRKRGWLSFVIIGLGLPEKINYLFIRGLGLSMYFPVYTHLINSVFSKHRTAEHLTELARPTRFNLKPIETRLV
jgi:hypothetical protein